MTSSTTFPHGRENSFTFLRVVFALAVVFGHSYVLGGFGEEPLRNWTGNHLAGREIAVQGFFIISGFLIAKSLGEHPSLWRFLCHRAFRILPAFWVYLFAMVFVVTPWILEADWPGQLSYGEWLTFGKQSPWTYFVKNVAVQSGAWNIVPLFGKNPVQYSVNGSLWSVTFEVCFYLCAALAVAARRVPPALTILGAIVAAVVAWKAPLMVICFTGAALLWRTLVPAGYGKAGLFIALYLTQLANTLAPEQLRTFLEPVYFLVWPMLNAAWCLSALMFLGGMLWWQFRAKMVWHGWLVALSLITLICGAIFRVWPFVAPLALPYLVLFLAARLPFQKFEKLGDPSYGIYLFSFPIQQSLAWTGIHSGGIALFALASILASALAGILSWIAIEKPALALGKKVGRWYERPAPASDGSAEVLVEVPKA